MEIREKIINHIQNLLNHIKISPTIIFTRAGYDENNIPEQILLMCKLYYHLNGKLLSNQMAVEKYVAELFKLKMGNCGDHAMLLLIMLLSDATLPIKFRDNLKIGKLNAPNDHFFVKSGEVIMDPWLALYTGFENLNLKEESGFFATPQDFINTVKTFADNRYIHDGILEIESCRNNTRFIKSKFGKIKSVLQQAL